jgi:protein involved in sex pheromone biosynthesis
MKKQIILSLFVALLLLSGCGIFKDRTVHVDKLDITSNTKETSKVKKETAHVDTGTLKTMTTTYVSDSSTTETHITPTPGTPFILDPDGTFHGEAQSVDTKTQKYYSNNETKKVDEKKGVSDKAKKESTDINKKEIHLQAKIKDAEAKPDYGWLLIVAAIVGLCVAAYVIYRKLF